MQTNKEIREEWSSEGWMKHGVHEDNLEGIADWWLKKMSLQEEKLREEIEGMKDGFNCHECGSEGYNLAIKEVLQVLEEKV